MSIRSKLLGSSVLSGQTTKIEQNIRLDSAKAPDPDVPTFLQNTYFDESRAKLWRAQEHLHNLSKVIEFLFNQNLHKMGLQQHAKGHWGLFTNFDLPINVGLSIGDCLRCLRSAMDYLICSLARAKGLSDDYTQFPFHEKRDNIINMFAPSREVKGKTVRAGSLWAVGQAYPNLEKTILSEIMPYSADDGADPFGDLLWRVITMDNIDKHRIITPTVQSGKLDSIRVNGVSITGCQTLGGSNFSVFSFDRIDPTQETYVNFAVDVIFGDDTRLSGKPVVSTLVEAINMALRVVDIFEKAFPKT